MTLLDKVQDTLDPFRLFEIEGHKSLAAIEDRITTQVNRIRIGHDAIDNHDVCSEIGQQHSAKWRGADACDFDDSDTGKRTMILHAQSSPCNRAIIGIVACPIRSSQFIRSPYHSRRA